MGDDVVDLFRAVSRKEADNLMDTGEFAGKHAGDAKWFAEDVDDALYYKDRLNGDAIVHTTISRSHYDELWHDEVYDDGWRRVVTVLDDQLDDFNARAGGISISFIE